MSTRFRLAVPRQLYADMIAQARAELPNECCGLLAGTIVKGVAGAIGRVQRRYPLVNAAASPREYEAAPDSLFAAFRDMRPLELLAIYHSHPTSVPVPSKKDLERNFYGPDVVFLIVSLKETEPEMRAWRLVPDAYEIAEWEILAE